MTPESDTHKTKRPWTTEASERFRLWKANAALREGRPLETIREQRQRAQKASRAAYWANVRAKKQRSRDRDAEHAASYRRALDAGLELARSPDGPERFLSM